MLLAVTLLAGCLGDDPAPAKTGDNLPDEVPTINALTGEVLDASLRPIPNATVSLDGGAETQQTDDAGTFQFDNLRSNTSYILEASAPDHLNATLGGATLPDQAHIIFILEVDPTTLPSHSTWKFKGRIECGAEYLIITGSCDIVAVFLNDAIEKSPLGMRPVPEPLQAEDRVDVTLPPRWQTLVVDVGFEPETQSGFNGIRIIAEPLGGSNTTEGEKYATVHGPASFTMRLDAGAPHPSEPEGPTIAPEAPGVRLRVFPHGHGYRALCQATDAAPCFLGFGAGTNLEFELLVTTWINEPAPDGWSLL